MLTRTLKRALPLALLSLLLCVSAQAQAQKIEVGTGVFCDTHEQVERFVTLFDGDEVATMKQVNAEVNDPTACSIGTVAFVRGPNIGTARTKKGTFNIFRVLVVGVLTDSGFRSAVPAAIFSIARIDERMAQIRRPVGPKAGWPWIG
jgi:hypothetical protein